MPFGLRNSAQTFQRFIHQVLRGLDYVYIYIDDILIVSETKEEHEKYLREVFERLHYFGLCIDKCVFSEAEVDFLGYRISSEGSSPLPQRLQALKEFKKPETLMELRRFLSIAVVLKMLLQNKLHSTIYCVTSRKMTNDQDS